MGSLRLSDARGAEHTEGTTRIRLLRFTLRYDSILLGRDIFPLSPFPLPSPPAWRGTDFARMTVIPGCDRRHSRRSPPIVPPKKTVKHRTSEIRGPNAGGVKASPGV